MKLYELLKEISFNLTNDRERNTEDIMNTEISDIIYDSRRIKRGCLFVCLNGSSFDGHSFAQAAVDGGAAAVVVCEDVSVVGAPVIRVDDTRLALAYISAAYFGHPADELMTVGITGTKGKTTTASMVAAILSAGGYKTGIIGTLGIVIDGKVEETPNTTPESYEIQRAMRKMVDNGCKCAVMEASSLGLKWHRTSGFIFDYGVFTNFSHDHIGGNEHKDMEEYLACKALLFKQCRLGLINIDDSYAEAVTAGASCGLETFGFNEKAQFVGSDDHLISKAGFLGVHFKVSGALSMEVDVDIPGKFMAYNALAAIAVCSHFDIPEQAIREGLSSVKVKGRVEPVAVPGNYTLLIDYAHNAISMESLLTILREYRPNRLITLFGAGGNRPRDRRYEMGEISGRLSDLSVVTEDNSRYENVMDIIEDIKVGISRTDGKYVVIPDRTDAIRYCMENAQDGDIIVLAGKGHENYQDKNGKKTHYDEREVIAQIIKEMAEKAQ